MRATPGVVRGPRHAVACSLVAISAGLAIATTACSSDRIAAPGVPPHHDVGPPELLAAYHRVDLPLGGASSGSVTALNGSGVALGTAGGQVVLWPAGAAAPVPVAGLSSASAIADDGTIAGSVGGHPAVWRDGEVTVLDTLPGDALAICSCESATVAGWVEVDGVRHAALWVDGVRIDAGVPPGYVDAEFTDLAMGWVVGLGTRLDLDPREPGSSDSVPVHRVVRWEPHDGWIPLALDEVSDVVLPPRVNVHGFVVSTAVVLANRARATGWDLTLDPPAGGVLPVFPLLLNYGVSAINDEGALVFRETGMVLGGEEFPPALGIARVDGGGLTFRLLPGSENGLGAAINSAGVVGGQVVQVNNGPPTPALWVPDAAP